MKRRLATALAIGIGLTAVIARSGAAALEIAVSVSPTTAVVGHPVEVLVRTFVPVKRDAIDLPPPSMGYPAPSDLWDVLYPIDYAFDVVARSPTGDELTIDLARDGTDASLWRGSFTPTVAGKWSIVMRNFPTSAPIQLDVAADVPNSGGWLIAIAALAIGLVGGLVVARVLRRPRPVTIARPE